MKSIRMVFLGIAAVLTVAFAVILSKPMYRTNTESQLPANAINSSSLQFAEDTTEYTDEISSDDGTTNSDEENLQSENSELSTGYTSETVTSSETSVLSTDVKTESITVTQRSETTTVRHETTTKRVQPTYIVTPSATQNQQSTVKETTTKPTSTTTAKTPVVVNDSMTVYITKTGKHYHYANPCGRGTYYATTLGEAKEMGLTPCLKCVH